MKEEIVRLQNVTMASGGERYLDNLNFYMLRGEIMGLIAARDKGRDEFIELLQRNLPIEYGRVYLGGRQVNSYLHSPGDQNRVFVISKKSSLIESLSVTDNVFVIRRGFRKFVVNDQVLRGQLLRLAGELGLSIRLDKGVKEFTPLERCEVEILKAHMMGCELIVLIDASDFVGQTELERLHERIRRLAGKGLSFLYICNHHEEAFVIADRVSLYSNGRIKKVFERDEMTDAAIAPYIMAFGAYQTRKRPPDENRKLEFRDVCTRHVRGLSFCVREGECVTVLDTDNIATEEIARILTGEEAVESGGIWYEGKPYFPQKQKDFLGNGIAVIPENPTKTFLFAEQTYLENLTFLLDRKLKKSVLKKTYLKSVRREFEGLSMGAVDETDISRLDIRQLYGLAYHRVLLYRPRLAVLIQPLAHGDMVCRHHILELIHGLCKAGVTVLILAGSISDNLHVSDRLVVLKDGVANSLSLSP